MKKLIFISCLLFAAMNAQAQFEQGTWFVNPSVTGLELSHSSFEDTTFGFEAHVGSFIIDNVAVLVNLGANWTENLDKYTLGVGGRYYFDKTGIYAGGGLKFNRMVPKGGKNINDFALGLEAGYAFFLSKTVTLEPGIFYDLSFKDSDYSKLGLKVGFGFYF